jgi:hypothetical protein
MFVKVKSWSRKESLGSAERGRRVIGINAMDVRGATDGEDGRLTVNEMRCIVAFAWWQ